MEDLGTGDIVAIVALIISVIAFVATILQVLQQYYSSATGYANCDAKVMGEWAKFTKRVLRPYELRFEVQYQTPVIFLAPSNNRNGPVPNREIWYVSGTPESYQETRTRMPEEDKRKQEKRSRKELVHTADNERATWVELLGVVQRMEKESNEWQQQFYLNDPGAHTPPIFEHRSLAVAVQSKPKSWDTMPSAMTKPYAQTTFGHLITLAATLGLHWKEFNRDTDRYRAEGNGYMLIGGDVSDLGLVFTFQRYGQTKFEENRVIPVREIKRLCFGSVPTIFATFNDEEFGYADDDEPNDLALLQLGSRKELAETLLIVGCNKTTANFFTKDDKKLGHLFPMAFELLGMIGQTLHARGSGFRMLPNPTIFHWDKKSFSMWKLLKAFKYELTHHDDINKTDQVMMIERNMEKIFKVKGGRADNEFTVAILDALHEALSDADSYLNEKYVTNDLVIQILRRHIEEVLAQINKEDPDGHNVFDELNSEAPEYRQSKFIRIYFDVIRPEVVQAVANRRKPTFHRDTPDSLGSASSDSVDLPRQGHHNQQPDVLDRHNNIWCTLVFRMICWLLLHDFHRKDVMIPKSELLGSRLPVYIV